MKVICVGDMHLSSKSVKVRIDDTALTGLNKLDWIYQFAKLNGISVVIQTGDFFNTAGQPAAYINKVIDIVSEYARQGVIMYAIGGNHDIVNGVYDNLWSSALGILLKSGVVRYLGDLALALENGLVRGYSSYQELNEDSAEKVVGLVCHHWISQAFGDTLVVYVNELKNKFKNLEWVLAGHAHAEFTDYLSSEGVRVIRRWCMWENLVLTLPLSL
jgi:DNA repair exonuclease SbcCD nuclease subunit